MKTKLIIASLAAAVFSVGAQAAEPDLKKGKKVFRKCKACHLVDKEKNKLGPHLVNVFGRKAAGLESYGKKYSKAMKAKGEEGLVWNEETLDAYLTKPKKYVPGTKMAFPGLKKEKQRINLIAYIKSFSKE
ncbi:MAG: cytochrome c family protein [Pseudomonadota bacterium]